MREVCEELGGGGADDDLGWVCVEEAGGGDEGVVVAGGGSFSDGVGGSELDVIGCEVVGYPKSPISNLDFVVVRIIEGRKIVEVLREFLRIDDSP